jgi:hypothetical protein
VSPLSDIGCTVAYGALVDALDDDGDGPPDDPPPNPDIPTDEDTSISTSGTSQDGVGMTTVVEVPGGAAVTHGTTTKIQRTGLTNEELVYM